MPLREGYPRLFSGCRRDIAFFYPGLRYLEPRLDSTLSSLFPLTSLLSGLTGFPGLTLLTSAATAASSSSLASPLAALLLRLALTLLLGAGQVGNGQSLRKVDLSADGVGQVADHEDILDMVVKVVLDLLGVDLGGQGQGVHEVLANSVVGLLILIEDTVDPLACSVEEVDCLLDRSAEALNVGDEGSCP